MTTSHMIDAAFLDYAVIGAAVLGTGGGGNPKIGYLMAKTAIARYGSVPLIQVSDLPHKAIAGSVSMMGAPSVSSEKIPNGQEFLAVLEALEKEKQVQVQALFPVEAGGINSMIPIVAAAMRGIPLVDCDCMGRAFPELQMVTQTIFDVPNTPMVLAHEKLDTVLVNAKDPCDMESYCRYLTLSFGGSAIMADAFVSKDELSLFAIQGIVSKSYEIGKIIKEADDPIAALSETCGAYHLFDGKITDLLRRYDKGFNKGVVKIQSFDGQEDYEIHLQNENLLAFAGGNPIAMVPDLISVLDHQTKMPITTENLKFGQRVSIIAFPCDEKWRLPKGLELAGPRKFGYDLDYQAIEVLQGGNG